MTKSNQPREPEVLHIGLLCFLFSGPNRRIRCGKEQPAVSLHQKWVQPWQSHNHRGGVQHQNSGAQRLHNQGPDLGHSWAGAIPSHYICVRVKPITFRGAWSGQPADMLITELENTGSWILPSDRACLAFSSMTRQTKLTKEQMLSIKRVLLLKPV